MSSYLRHLAANWGVATRALALAMFHFLHGLAPCAFTEHERWGLRLYKPKDQ